MEAGNEDYKMQHVPKQSNAEETEKTRVGWKSGKGPPGLRDGRVKLLQEERTKRRP